MKTRSKLAVTLDVLEDKENYSPNRNATEIDDGSVGSDTPSFCRSIASITPLSPRSRRSSFGTPLSMNSVGTGAYLSPLSPGRSRSRSALNSTSRSNTPFSSSVRDHDNWRRRKITAGEHNGGNISTEVSPLSVGFSKFYDYHEHNNHQANDVKDDMDSFSVNTGIALDDPSFISVESIDHRHISGKKTTLYSSRFVSPTHAVYKLLMGNDDDMSKGREFTDYKQNVVIRDDTEVDEDEERETGLSLRKMMQTRAFTLFMFFFLITLIFSNYKTMHPQNFIRDDLFPSMLSSSNDNQSWKLNFDYSLWNDLFFNMKGKNDVLDRDISKDAAGASSSCSASGICIVTNGFHKAGEIKEIKPSTRRGISNKYDRKDIYPSATPSQASLQNVEAQTIRVFKVTVKAADTVNRNNLNANRVLMQHPIKTVQTVQKDVVSSVKSSRGLPSMVVGEVERWPTHAPTAAVNMIQQFHARMSLQSMVVGEIERWPTHAPTSAVAMIKAFQAKQSLPSMEVGEVQLYPSMAPSRAVQIIQDFHTKRAVRETQHKMNGEGIRITSSKLNMPAIGVTPLLPCDVMKEHARSTNSDAFFEIAYGTSGPFWDFKVQEEEDEERESDVKSHSIAMMKINAAYTSLLDLMPMTPNTYHKHEVVKELEPLLKEASFYTQTFNNTSSWEDAPSDSQLAIHPLCSAKSKTAIDLLLSVDVFSSQDSSSATLFTSGQVLRPLLISVEYGSLDTQHDDVIMEEDQEESTSDNDNDSVSVSMPSSLYTDYIPFKLDLVVYDYHQVSDIDILGREGKEAEKRFEYKVLPVKTTGVVSVNQGFYRYTRPSSFLPKVLNTYSSETQVPSDRYLRNTYSTLVYRRQNSLMLRSLNMDFTFNINTYGKLVEAPSVVNAGESSKKQGVQSTMALSILSQRRDIPCFEEKDAWALVTGNDGVDSSFPNRLQLETDRLTYTAITEPTPMIRDAQDMIREYIQNAGSSEGLQHIHREKLSLIASEKKNGAAFRNVTKLNLRRSFMNTFLLNVLKSFSLPVMAVIFFITLSKHFLIKPAQAED